MKKSKIYEHVRFTPEKLKSTIEKWLQVSINEGNIIISSRKIDFGNESWEYDKDFEFFSDLQKKYESASVYLAKTSEKGKYEYSFHAIPQWTQLSIEAPSRDEIEEIFYVIDKDWEQFKIPEKEIIKTSPIIFIGHGRSLQWRDLKDHLHDKHGYKIQAYETGARAGHTIRDILDDMLTNSSMGILVMTGEDELENGKIQARPNVIHETGLFQGRLGFSRAIILLEDGTEEFSNLYGIQQIRYSKNNIKETFGEVLATIKREFG